MVLPPHHQPVQNPPDRRSRRLPAAVRPSVARRSVVPRLLRRRLGPAHHHPSHRLPISRPEVGWQQIHERAPRGTGAPFFFGIRSRPVVRAARLGPRDQAPRAMVPGAGTWAADAAPGGDGVGANGTGASPAADRRATARAGGAEHGGRGRVGENGPTTADQAVVIGDRQEQSRYRAGDGTGGSSRAETGGRRWPACPGRWHRAGRVACPSCRNELSDVAGNPPGASQTSAVETATVPPIANSGPGAAKATCGVPEARCHRPRRSK